MFSTAAIADQPVHRRIIRLPEVIRRAGVSKSTIYDRMNKGQFPAQAKPLKGSPTAGWYEDEIDAHIESREARPRLKVEAVNPSQTAPSADLPTVALRWVPLPKEDMAKPGRLRKSKGQKASNEPGLMATDMKITGYDEVYLQTSTGKLFGEIGRLPESLLSLIVALQNFDQPILGSE